MNTSDEMQEYIRETVRGSIKSHLNEDVGIPVSFFVLGTFGAQAYLRQLRRVRETNKLMKKFIDQNDKQNIIGEKFPELFRRFKVVNSLSDLEKIERQVEKYINTLDTMLGRVDKFVDEEYRKEKSIGDYVLMTNPQKEKERLRKQMKTIMKETRDAFKQQVEAKKDELLS